MLHTIEQTTGMLLVHEARRGKSSWLISDEVADPHDTLIDAYYAVADQFIGEPVIIVCRVDKPPRYGQISRGVWRIPIETLTELSDPFLVNSEFWKCFEADNFNESIRELGTIGESLETFINQLRTWDQTYGLHIFGIRDKGDIENADF